MVKQRPGNSNGSANTTSKKRSSPKSSVGAKRQKSQESLPLKEEGNQGREVERPSEVTFEAAPAEAPVDYLNLAFGSFIGEQDSTYVVDDNDDESRATGEMTKDEPVGLLLMHHEKADEEASVLLNGEWNSTNILLDDGWTNEPYLGGL